MDGRHCWWPLGRRRPDAGGRCERILGGRRPAAGHVRDPPEPERIGVRARVYEAGDAPAAAGLAPGDAAVRAHADARAPAAVAGGPEHVARAPVAWRPAVPDAAAGAGADAPAAPAADAAAAARAAAAAAAAGGSAAALRPAGSPPCGRPAALLGACRGPVHAQQAAPLGQGQRAVPGVTAWCGLGGRPRGRRRRRQVRRLAGRGPEPAGAGAERGCWRLRVRRAAVRHTRRRRVVRGRSGQGTRGAAFAGRGAGGWPRSCRSTCAGRRPRGGCGPATTVRRLGAGRGPAGSGGLRS
mmetsp:Transcript_70180/g.219017  ORF Transcript_70180/g.219017 Transcript_70180/m.219017 type:complete len:297 (-) Transcript_70180:833-1723(-)